ncbi:ROK family protein [Acidaminobacter sp. JC074]|uniref:ROK family protein n=1 Tax=Acidaminobacter sp. JC074 TaxID=2530199 RepID=UPI001F0F69FD|nr:ROK family protein [Acidaminobacter sp. JC074]
MIIAIDIGGTNIKFSYASPDGILGAVESMPTDAYLGADNMYKRIENLIGLADMSKVTGIAISSAGQIDSDKGRVIFATDSIPGYTGFEIKKRLEEKFKVKVTVENDVNCAALGELWKGHLSSESFLALTLGTGIGGAIVEDGKIYHGSGYSTAEFGHLALVYKGLECTCGHRGCYERYASAKALNEQISDKLGDMDTKLFFEACRQGNEAYLRVLDQWVDYVSEGLKSLVHTFNPNLILIGGGVSAQGDYLADKIKESLKGKVMPSFMKDLDIKMMTLGNDANLLGAVYHFNHQ